MTTLQRVQDHYNEALQYFPNNNIVGIFLQGSQNYGLQTPKSDVDTKLVVTPTFKDIVIAKSPISTTHVRENNEHIDFKDVRLHLQLFRKQNVQFTEILFTPFFFVNPLYRNQWDRLREAQEDIAHMNPFTMVKSIKGMAMQKYHAMEHPYPSKVSLIEQYGYDGKQLSHLVRLQDFLFNYTSGKSFAYCLTHPQDKQFLIDLKENKMPLDWARHLAEDTLKDVAEMADAFCSVTPNRENKDIVELLNDVQYNIMKLSVETELQE